MNDEKCHMIRVDLLTYLLVLTHRDAAALAAKASKKQDPTSSQGDGKSQ